MSSEDKDLVALRGSTEASIKEIDKKIEALDKKIQAEPPEPTPPTGTGTDQESEEYQQFVKDKEKFLKEKQDFETKQKKSYLEPFSKEEREAYKDLSLKDLVLITTDRKNRKDGLFLTEPPATPTPADLTCIGWGVPPNGTGYGWYNAKGEILSKDRNSPYGVKK